MRYNRGKMFALRTDKIKSGAGYKSERLCSKAGISMWRAASQTETINQLKSAEAIVYGALKLVSIDEGQNLTSRTILYFPDEKLKSEKVKQYSKEQHGTRKIF